MPQIHQESKGQRNLIHLASARDFGMYADLFARHMLARMIMDPISRARHIETKLIVPSTVIVP